MQDVPLIFVLCLTRNYNEMRLIIFEIPLTMIVTWTIILQRETIEIYYLRRLSLCQVVL